MSSVNETRKKELVDELRRQWRAMWRQRIDDRLRAEGIADSDYPLLFVDRGTVIIATRKFRPPDFFEILQKHNNGDGSVGCVVPPSPSVGGWGRFIRTVLRRQRCLGRRERLRPEPVRRERQQLKKGGRGWLHFVR